jgi:5-methylthioadenosine/S-adenosylhomocysteine deaminase
MFGEMAATAKLHKVNRLDPTLLPAGRVVAMATSGGATVLGLGEEIGTLAVGRRADLIIVDLAKPHLTPRYDADSLLAYAASGSDVKTSIVNGRVIMENYRLLTIDLAEVLARVNNLARQVRAATSPE